MTTTQLTITILSAMLTLLLTCCIHTYPHGDGIDPTLVQVGVEVSVDIDWDIREIAFSKSEIHENDFDYRLIIEFTRNNKSIGHCEHYLTQAQFSSGNIKLIMPFTFHAVNYQVTAWLDAVEKDSHSTVSYQVAGLADITRIDNHISWSEDKICAATCTDISLQNYKNQWGAKVKIPLTLTPPVGRFKMIASDMKEFMEYAANSISQGEIYSVCLSFENRIARGFNANENLLTRYQERPEYYFPMPTTGNEIISGVLFSDDTAMQLAATVLIYNSARLIVSKSPVITFPIERGKLTIITGEMLTTFYSNNINVNNVWDGEIIIEL